MSSLAKTRWETPLAMYASEVAPHGSRAMSRTRRPWSLVVAAIILSAAALAVDGCAVDSAPAERARSGAVAPPGWIGPGILHGVHFFFETPTAEPPSQQSLEIGHEHLSLGKVRVDFLLQRFYIAGRPYEFAKGTSVLLYRPPPPGTPWHKQLGGVNVSWQGDGNAFPWEAQEPNGERSLHLGHAVVALPPGGEVQFRAPEESRSTLLPKGSRIQLNTRGIPIEK